MGSRAEELCYPQYVGTDAQRTIDAMWRTESPKRIGALTRLVRDVAIAEELAQDALEQCPRQPGAWLMSAAKHRARRGSLIAGKHEALAQELEQAFSPDLDARLDDPIGDDLLRLLFISCHPVLAPEARVALPLRLL